MTDRKKYPHGSIFLGRDERTYGKEGTGSIAYDPDFECGGPEGTPNRKCPYTLEEGEEMGKGGKFGGDDRLLHVGLASHRDPLCPKTLFFMFTKASKPHLIRVRIVQQNDPELDVDCLEKYCELMAERDGVKDGSTDCPYKDQIYVHRIHAKDAKGPTYARGLLSIDIASDYEKGLVSEQDFCLSMDSHMNFEEHFDTSMIEMWEMAQNEYAVLSTYVDSDEHLGKANREVPHLCMVMFTSSVRTHATKACTGLTKPKLTNGVYGAGLSFSKCHAELKVPVDVHTPWVFDGEEFNRAARYWTYGYDIYTPHKVFILHNYHESQSNPKTTSWMRTIDRKEFSEANKRINTIIDVPGGYKESDKIDSLKKSKYGLGDRRTLDQLIQFSGIDLRNRKPTIDGKNRCGNLQWVDFIEHPKGVNYIPKFDEHENPLDTPDPTSVWYEADQIIDVEKRFPERQAAPNPEQMAIDGENVDQTELPKEGDIGGVPTNAVNMDQTELPVEGDVGGVTTIIEKMDRIDNVIDGIANEEQDIVDSGEVDDGPAQEITPTEDVTDPLQNEFEEDNDPDGEHVYKDDDLLFAIQNNNGIRGGVPDVLSNLLPPVADVDEPIPQKLPLLRSLTDELIKSTSSYPDEHGVKHLPVLLQLTVVMLVIGLVVSIASSRGTGRGGKRSIKKHSV